MTDFAVVNSSNSNKEYDEETSIANLLKKGERCSVYINGRKCGALTERYDKLGYKMYHMPDDNTKLRCHICYTKAWNKKQQQKKHRKKLRLLRRQQQQQQQQQPPTKPKPRSLQSQQQIIDNPSLDMQYILNKLEKIEQQQQNIQNNDILIDQHQQQQLQEEKDKQQAALFVQQLDKELIEARSIIAEKNKESIELNEQIKLLKQQLIRRQQQYEKGTRSNPFINKCRFIDPASNHSIIIGIPKQITNKSNIIAEPLIKDPKIKGTLFKVYYLDEDNPTKIVYEIIKDDEAASIINNNNTNNNNNIITSSNTIITDMIEESE